MGLDIGAKIKAVFAKVGHLFEAEGKTALDAFEEKLTPDAIELMGDAVQYVASAGIGGTAARDAAVEKFMTDVKTAGKDVVAFSIAEAQTLVQLVYLEASTKLNKLNSGSNTQPPTTSVASSVAVPA